MGEVGEVQEPKSDSPFASANWLVSSHHRFYFCFLSVTGAHIGQEKDHESPPSQPGDEGPLLADFQDEFHMLKELLTEFADTEPLFSSIEPLHQKTPKKSLKRKCPNPGSPLLSKRSRISVTKGPNSQGSHVFCSDPVGSKSPKWKEKSLSLKSLLPKNSRKSRRKLSIMHPLRPEQKGSFSKVKRKQGKM